MSGVPGFAVAVDAAWAGGVGDAELVGVEEEGIGVADVELVFLARQALLLSVDCLGEALAQSG